MATIVLALIILRLAFWIIKQDGLAKVQGYMEARQARSNFIKVSKLTQPARSARS